MNDNAVDLFLGRQPILDGPNAAVLNGALSEALAWANRIGCDNETRET